MVLSSGESRGIVISPNYPQNYPINVTCHYYVDGLVDKQNLEKVKLRFDDFDLPTVRDRSVSSEYQRNGNVAVDIFHSVVRNYAQDRAVVHAV